MTSDEFKSHLEELQRILSSISEYYKIWLQLQPAERRIEILNRFNGFFVPVRQALFEMMFIHAAKIFEHNSETISLWRLVDTGKQDPSLVPYAEQDDLDNISTPLSPHDASISNAIAKLSDYRSAHMQTVSSQRTPLTEEEFEGLIEDIQAVINRLSAIHDREHDDWRLQTDRSAWETAKILDVLQ